MDFTFVGVCPNRFDEVTIFIVVTSETAHSSHKSEIVSHQ